MFFIKKEKIYLTITVVEITVFSSERLWLGRSIPFVQLNNKKIPLQSLTHEFNINILDLKRLVMDIIHNCDLRKSYHRFKKEKKMHLERRESMIHM